MKVCRCVYDKLTFELQFLQLIEFFNILPMQTKASLLLSVLLITSNAVAGHPAIETPASVTDSNNLSNSSPGNVPATIGNFYSDVDMRVRLAIKPNLDACVAEQCAINAAFEQKVALLSETLVNNAHSIYPDLKKRVPKFLISVIDKKEVGMASNAGGKVVVFRGVQQFQLSEDALKFLIAREMGHVIAKHHDKNTTTKIVFSVLASVLFPAVALISASTAAAQATTATSLITSAASTATSYLGSEVAISRIKPTQLAESDEIAITLMNVQGWNMPQTSLNLKVEYTEPNGWLEDLHASLQNLKKLVAQSAKKNIEQAQMLESLIKEKLTQDNATQAELE